VPKPSLNRPNTGAKTSWASSIRLCFFNTSARLAADRSSHPWAPCDRAKSIALRRVVTRRGSPMELGARSLDILIALLSRPNEAISKRDLAQVWPDAIAEEGSLWFQIAKLRSRLRQNKNIIAIR